MAGKGSRFDMKGLKTYGHAKKVLGDWARDLATRVSAWDCN